MTDIAARLESQDGTASIDAREKSRRENVTSFADQRKGDGAPTRGVQDSSIRSERDSRRSRETTPGAGVTAASSRDFSAKFPAATSAKRVPKQPSRESTAASIRSASTSPEAGAEDAARRRRNKSPRETKSTPAKRKFEFALSTNESGKLRSTGALRRSSCAASDARESPVNPYSRSKGSKFPPPWPLPDTEEESVAVVNVAPSLERGAFPECPLDECSCRPASGAHRATAPRADEECCAAEWMRKEFYFEVKKRVENAVKSRKIFLIRGELPKLKEALEERGWVQKYEASKTRLVPYGSVASLEAKSLGDVRQPDGTLNERALVFSMLRHRTPDFIWDCRNDFVEWDSTLSSDTLLNRFQKSFVYTSKLGMAHLLQDAHWLHQDDVSSVLYPRSYNLSREADAFLQDYRRTAAAGLLKWFAERMRAGPDVLATGTDPIETGHIEFAIKRCEEFAAHLKHQDLDEDAAVISDKEWGQFLGAYVRALHEGNGIASGPDDVRARLEKLDAAANSALKSLEDVDPQYALSGMRNIWILKPSDLCCGTGISISHSAKDIFRRVACKPKDYFVVQKYIERPLLVCETKFDIRAWYLVTNTSPLTIWMFKEALLRLSSRPYAYTTYHEAIHLCNTAIQEKYDEEKRRRRKRKNVDEVAVSVRDQGWDCEKLNEYLKSVGYEGEPYYDGIYPKMVQSIVLTMLASQDYMEKRRCSFELYGADFMVMEDLSVWLIEINTNPRMHPPSSKITERLYSSVQESLVKVIMDLPTNPWSDTGGFELAFKQNLPDFRPYLGPCLFVFGQSIAIHEHPPNARKIRKAGRSNSSAKQRRVWTAPPMMPRQRDPKIVDFIDYLNNSRYTTAH